MWGPLLMTNANIYLLWAPQLELSSLSTMKEVKKKPSLIGKTKNQQRQTLCSALPISSSSHHAEWPLWGNCFCLDRRWSWNLAPTASSKELSMAKSQWPGADRWIWTERVRGGFLEECAFHSPLLEHESALIGPIKSTTHFTGELTRLYFTERALKLICRWQPLVSGPAQGCYLASCTGESRQALAQSAVNWNWLAKL